MPCKKSAPIRSLSSPFILAMYFLFFLAGCSQVQVPEYPGAVEDQDQAHEATFYGISFGKVRRMITEDSYDTVFSYYKNVLAVHNPEITSHTLEDGQQGAITITQGKNRSVTVAIQEFRKEGKTAITYLDTGSGTAGWLSLFITWLFGLLF